MTALVIDTSGAQRIGVMESFRRPPNCETHPTRVAPLQPRPTPSSVAPKKMDKKEEDLFKEMMDDH